LALATTLGLAATLDFAETAFLGAGAGFLAFAAGAGLTVALAFTGAFGATFLGAALLDGFALAGAGFTDLVLF